MSLSINNQPTRPPSIGGHFSPSSAMYTVTTKINQHYATPLTFKNWQSAYKYVKAAQYLWKPEWNPKIEHYSISVHNASGIEIKKVTIF